MLQDRAFDLPRYLAALPLCKDLAPELVAGLAAGSRLRRHGRGDTLFRAGEPCNEFFITVYGQIKLFALSTAGREKVLELVGPGMTFAEAPMFAGAAHRVNAQALADTLLLGVNRQAVLDTIERAPGFAVCLLGNLSRRLHRLMDDVEAYALHSGLRRVADYLLDELQRGGATAHSVVLPVSKATIALRLSLTPEYCSRVLHQLESDGLIRIDKRAITIASPECLRAYSSFEPGTPLPRCPRGGTCVHHKQRAAVN